MRDRDGLPAPPRGPGKPWNVVAEKEGVRADELLLGLLGAGVDSADGAVRLTSPGPGPQLPFPGPRVRRVLLKDPAADLALRLDRGRMDLVNLKEAGPAKWPRPRFGLGPDPRRAGAGGRLELYGRWPAGVHFTREPGPKDVPTANLVFLVLKGGSW